MKKVYKISIFALTLFATLSVTAHSFSLSVNAANSGSFAITQLEKSYYLKGTFNEWEASNDYKLEDVSESMSPEQGKIKEYTITKSLSVNDNLKIWDSSNRWYTHGDNNCSYVDKWTRDTESGGNYIVPMSADYTFSLKLFNSGASIIDITAPDLTTLYLKPNANWLSDGARFAAYFFNDETSVWADLDQDGDYYTVAMPDDYNKVIFCRMNPATEENNWDNKWNQTGNLDFSKTGYLCEYVVPDGAWDSSTNENWRAR